MQSLYLSDMRKPLEYLSMAAAINVQHEKTFEINAFEKKSEKEPDQM